MRQTKQELKDTAAPAVAQTPGPIEPLNLRLPEAVRFSGFSRSDLYRRNAAGQIVFRKAGKAVLVDVASLKAAVAALPAVRTKVA